MRIWSRFESGHGTGVAEAMLPKKTAARRAGRATWNCILTRLWLLPQEKGEKKRCVEAEVGVQFRGGKEVRSLL